ncbi:hypothetical protein EVA_04549 [gut metagenome]|uniref:Uncharacterized protein n=1 Tax=gut metagenome TaxID=749906 RepID=J9H1M9_9ZZZZ
MKSADLLNDFSSIKGIAKKEREECREGTTPDDEGTVHQLQCFNDFLEEAPVRDGITCAAIHLN